MTWARLASFSSQALCVSMCLEPHSIESKEPEVRNTEASQNSSEVTRILFSYAGNLWKPCRKATLIGKRPESRFRFFLKFSQFVAMCLILNISHFLFVVVSRVFCVFNFFKGAPFLANKKMVQKLDSTTPTQHQRSKAGTNKAPIAACGKQVK